MDEEFKFEEVVADSHAEVKISRSNIAINLLNKLKRSKFDISEKRVRPSYNIRESADRQDITIDEIRCIKDIPKNTISGNCFSLCKNTYTCSISTVTHVCIDQTNDKAAVVWMPPSKCYQLTRNVYIIDKGSYDHIVSLQCMDLILRPFNLTRRKLYLTCNTKIVCLDLVKIELDVVFEGQTKYPMVLGDFLYYMEENKTYVCRYNLNAKRPVQHSPWRCQPPYRLASQMNLNDHVFCIETLNHLFESSISATFMAIHPKTFKITDTYSCKISYAFNNEACRSLLVYRGVSMAMFKLTVVQPSDAQLLIMTILRSKIRAVRFMTKEQTLIEIDPIFNIITSPSYKQ